jgi:alkanesulfonate monooxygenase SsuD/methylene tetrahydromethanopterin reductase-like flavin-dependent oxidoreductase (luciferase family)
MEVGVALPTMAAGYTRETTLQWARGIDDGPFSSVSCGERVTFRNQEMLVTLAAAAAVTERVRVFANLVVAPFHSPVEIAKALATIDVLCDGRLSVGVGVGGREHDYKAVGSTFERRHARLDAAVGEVRKLWSGRPPFEGADPVGPSPVQGDRVEILAGAMGPKSLARAAKWADGVAGFSIAADPGEMANAVSAAAEAWVAEGRSVPPRHVSGCFYVVGVDDSQAELSRFTYEYLRIFGESFASSMANSAPVWNADRLGQALDEARESGVDEFILVPGTVDPACLEATLAAVSAWMG